MRKPPTGMALVVFMKSEPRLSLFEKFQIINYEELEFEHGEHHEVGMGAAMQVSLASWKGQLVAVKSARSEAAESKLHNQRVHSLEKRLHDLSFELQIMSHRPLCEHLNIVQLKGISFWGNRDEELCPVMIVEPACREYPDLTRFVLSQNGNVQADLAAGIIADIADGISVLHVYGVIHGDVKPGNVLIFPRYGRRLACR